MIIRNYLFLFVRDIIEQIICYWIIQNSHLTISVACQREFSNYLVNKNHLN